MKERKSCLENNILNEERERGTKRRTCSYQDKVMVFTERSLRIVTGHLTILSNVDKLVIKTSSKNHHDFNFKGKVIEYSDTDTDLFSEHAMFWHFDIHVERTNGRKVNVSRLKAEP